MKSKLLILFFIVLGTGLRGQHLRCYIYDHADTPRERFFDFITTDIFVDIDPYNSTVYGEVLHSFAPLRNHLDTIWLDGPAIIVDKAYINEKLVDWQQHKEGITFKYPREFSQDSTYNLRIQYKAQPQKGLYFIGWNDPTERRRKQIWTQGQGIDNRHWFPHFDDMSEKVFVSTTVVFDSTYKVLSNGVLDQKIDNGDGTYTWYYKMRRPHASYLTMLAIGDYEIDTLQSKNGTPIHLWYYPDWEDRVDATYYKTKEMVDYFEDWFSLTYPWGSYSQVPVEDFLYGAMENTSATIFGDFYFVDEREFIEKNYVYVNAHEFVHQWLGDLVTSRSSASHWIHESMATYFHTRWYGEVFGNEEFDLLLRSYRDAAYAASTKDNYAISNAKAGASRFYLKGAYVMEMLKNHVGEEHFKQAINYFIQKHAYQNIDGNDLLNAFHESTGYSLRWFWDQWIYRGGEPHLSVEFQETEKSYLWKVKQDESKQNNILFRLPLTVEVHYENGNKDSHTVWLENTDTTFSFQRTNGQIKFPVIDPGCKILKNMDFERNVKYIKNQASQGLNMMDRLDAVQDLRSLQIDKKRKVLQQIFKKESEHYAIKQEIVNQLAGDAKSDWIIQKALSDSHFKVRLAALNHFSPDSKKKIQSLEPLLEDRSYSIVELSLLKLIYSASEKKEEYFKITDQTWGNSSANVRITWLAFNIQTTNSETDKSRYIDELIDLTSSSYNFEVRSNAASVVNELGIFNAKLAGNLIDGLTDFNRKLKGSFAKVVRQYAENDSYKEIIIDLIGMRKLSPSQDEYLRRVLAY